MSSQSKRTFAYIAFGVALFAALMNLGALWDGVRGVVAFFMPVIAGLAAAFILSVPMKGFERLICRAFRRCKRRPEGRPLHAAALLLTFASFAVVVYLVFTLTLPQLRASVMSIAEVVQERWPEWMAWLDANGFGTEALTELASSIDLEGLIEKLSGSAGAVIGSVVDVSMSIASGAATAGIALIIAIYVLLDRQNLARQAKRVLYTYVPEKYAGGVCRVAALAHSTYTRFLSGQCVEAVILALLMTLTFTLAGLPYAGLVGVLAGFFAFVPYVGAVAACVIGVLLIAIADPSKAILAAVVYAATQFVENQFIYPNVVGTSVGLPPLWTFIAVLIGGKLLGLAGMLFFIPLTAVAYTLLREDVKRHSDGAQRGDTVETAK